MPALYRAQHDAIYHPARYVIIEASTKAGKTAGCLVWQLGQCFEHGGNHWWVAPVYAQARMAWSRARDLVPRGLLAGSNRSELTLTLANGAVWTFRSGEKPDNLYGEDVRSAVIDEASRCRDEVWHAVRSTLTATGGQCRMIGNVRGRSNFHYTLARKAEAGEPGYHYARLTAWDAVDGGVIPRSEIEDARRSLPEHVFRELYEAIPSDDGGNPFGLDAIVACSQPMPDTEPVVWGADVARVHDWTVVVGIDANAQVCRVHRWRKPWGETVERIAEICGRTPGYIDATGAGDVVSEMLARKGVALEPFVFSASSKQQIMERLALGLQQRHLRIPDSGVVRTELETMEYAVSRTGVRYEAASGLHDDAVCALALAWEYGGGRMMLRHGVDRGKRSSLSSLSSLPRAPIRGIGERRTVRV